MNSAEEIIRCDPSQLVNLKYLPGVLAVLALVFVPKAFLAEIIPVAFIPEKLVGHVFRIPEYLAATGFLFFGYQMIKVWCIRNEITTGELRHVRGILRRRHGYIELYRIKDFQVDRPLVYRIFGLGTLIVYTSDKTSPVFRLEAIRRPEIIYSILRERVEQNRREKHVFEVD